jgi:speckle-type POZ protein
MLHAFVKILVCITFFPDGFSDETADWIGVGLCLVDQIPTNGDVKARLSMSLLDQVGDPVQAYYRRSTVLTFSITELKARAITDFIKRKDLE